MLRIWDCRAASTSIRPPGWVRVARRAAIWPVICRRAASDGSNSRASRPAARRSPASAPGWSGPRYCGRESVPASVGADVGDAPPTAAGRGQRDADIPDRTASQAHGGELPGSLAGGDGSAPVHAVGAGRDRVAARIITGGHAGIEDDLPDGDRPAEVDLKVLAGGLAGASRVAGAGVSVHGVGRHVAGAARVGGAGRVRRRGPAFGADLAQRVGAGNGAPPGEGGQRPAGKGVAERLVALTHGEGARVVVLVMR